MSAAVRPRRLAWRGVVDAVGLLVDRAADEREARRRVLARWAPGAAVHALGTRYVLTFAAPRPLRAEAADGAALVRCSGSAPVTLSSAVPLSRAEVDGLVAIGARGDHVVVARGGVAESVALAPSGALDPSAWIDLDAVALLDLPSLGAPPVVVVAPVEGKAGDGPALRPAAPASVASALSQALDALAGDQALAPDMARLVDDVRRAAAPAPEPPKPGFFEAAVASLRAAVARALQPPRPTDRAVWVLPPATGGAAPGASSTAPSKASWWSRLRGWLQKRLVRPDPPRLLGGDQARYLERMIAMFREGDLDAALRHAIPLGGPPSPNAPPKPVTYEAPRAREALTIQLQPTTSTTATGGSSLHGLLRMLYRNAATALEAEGRVEEAAFTLAELLREPGEAVALLERHRRYVLAAELAEAALLAPELRVRQWILADDLPRAIGVARQHGVFAAALARFKDEPVAADALRRAWARHLASTGDFAAAVGVGTTVADLADEVEAWGDAVLALGGAAALRVLARRLSQRPADFAALRPHVEVLVGADGVEALADRATFAQAAAGEVWSEGLALAARMLARPQTRDAARTNDPVDLQTLQGLLTLSRDAVLRADVPTWPTFARVPLVSRVETWRHAVAARDTGPGRVHDAAFLRDRGMLLALGEGGASLRGRDGAERARVDDPAHRIVWCDHGDRALLLGARGASWRVARLDVTAGRSAPWGECTLDAFADDYDGDGWLVGQEGEVLLLDPTAPDLRALPGPGRTPRTAHARVRCVGRNANGAAAVRAITAVERWRWRLPGWALLERPLEPVDATAVAVHPSGVVARRREAGGLVVDRGMSQPLLELPCAPGTAAEITHFAPPWVTWVERAPDAVTVSVFHLTTARRLVELRLEGATEARGRVIDEVLAVGDDRGRALAVDLRSGTLLRDLRV